MCIAVFAKQKKIQVEYASESIWLDKDGLMKVVVDLLITNKSQEVINELNCIIPQRLFTTDLNRLPKKYKNKHLYEDLTAELCEKNSEYNNPVEKSYSFRTDNRDPSKQFIDLEIANPYVPTQNMKYSGIYDCDNQMNRNEEIDPLGHVILSDLKFSALKIKLNSPMLYNTPRWFRWKFLTLSGPLQRLSRAEYHYLKILNKLHFHYSVNGPTRVMKIFKTLLDSFQMSIESKINKYSANYGTILQSYGNLYTNMVNLNIAHESTKVSIIDWRTRIYNWKLEPFSSIQSEDNVKIAGSQPNYVPGYKAVYYEWKTGKLHSASNDDQADFTVRFSTKYESDLYRYLPIVSFLLAIVGIILSLML